MFHPSVNQIHSLRSCSSWSLLLPMTLVALLTFPTVDALACVNDAECADDGSICTAEVCNPASPGADAFGCTHPNPADPAPICPTAYSGLSTVVFMDVGNPIDLVLVEAGPLPTAAGGAGESYLVDSNISEPDIELTTQELHALTIGQGNVVNSSASVASLNAVVTGVAITADMVSSQSQTVCENGVASIDGSSAYTNLIVAGQSITASGQPNQVIVIPSGDLVVTVILNEQTGSAVGGAGDITVAAAHIFIDNTQTGRRAEVVLASSHSDIECGIAEHCTTNADCTDDGNVCTNEVCDVNAPGADPFGCGHPNNTVPCDDQDACSMNDQCVDGQCTPGTSAECGDGVVDLACGEECDTPGGEVCNNGVDDDGDLLADCADPDCANADLQGCSDQCQLTPPCVPILGDPAVIYTDDTGERLRDGQYGFAFHGRIEPTTPVDPLVDGFIVALSNVNGEIYRAVVSANDLESRGRRYYLKGASAEAAKRDGGIGSLFIRSRVDGGRSGFGIRVKAYGEFSRATLAEMSTQVYFGDDVAYLTATWTRRPRGWMLRQNQY